VLIDRGGYKNPPPWPRPRLKGLDEMPRPRRSLRRAAVTASRYLAIAALVGGVVYCIRYPSVLNRILNQPIFHRKLIWSRPAVAPNGSPWPTRSNYVAGYPHLNVSGIAKVTADNSGGPSDLFVKLVDRDQKQQRVVRVFFVKVSAEVGQLVSFTTRSCRSWLSSCQYSWHVRQYPSIGSPRQSSVDSARCEYD